MTEAVKKYQFRAISRTYQSGRNTEVYRYVADLENGILSHAQNVLPVTLDLLYETSGKLVVEAPEGTVIIQAERSYASHGGQPGKLQDWDGFVLTTAKINEADWASVRHLKIEADKLKGTVHHVITVNGKRHRLLLVP